MSSARRSANEVNILDMLDRQASGPLPRRMLRSLRNWPAPVWYGAAGLLVCSLVGTLAWLAHDGKPAAVDTALAGSIKPVAEAPAADVDTVGNAPLVASAGGRVVTPDAAPDEAPPAASGGATIVELAPPSEPESPAPSVVAPAPARALAPQQAPGRIAAHAVPRDPPRPAAHTVPAKAAPRAGRSATLAHADAAGPRSRRQPAPARTAAPVVDTDVALISAIIQHAANRQEAEEAGCTDKPCAARKP